MIVRFYFMDHLFLTSPGATASSDTLYSLLVQQGGINLDIFLAIQRDMVQNTAWQYPHVIPSERVTYEGRSFKVEIDFQ